MSVKTVSQNLERQTEKDLYNYQKKAIDKVFKAFDEAPSDYHLLYQLPTGGGKTVIFSEFVRQYLKNHDKKVVVLTHRIELLKQTSRMLTEFNVTNKVIDSKANLDDQANYSCFVAMVETLNNRLQEDMLDISDVGLVIIDEAHYNSFTKLFKYFENSFILGVTATPLSSNKELPMKDNYNELITGETIESLIENNFLSPAETYQYNVGLTSLEVGSNGDYTVKSSEDLYTNTDMLKKVVYAYEQHSLNKKTLIFNNGINTSLHVYDTFKRAGYTIAHLDNTATKKERKMILKWFKETPNAILTSVSILTTGFDEPSVDTIILNRATKSLALYYQMVGRGSRIYPGKEVFRIIDLGNNMHRFGPWGADINWQKIFGSPNYYLDSIINDDDIEANFRYEMPEAIRKEFANSEEVYFDMKQAYTDSVNRGDSSKVLLEQSIAHHTKICVENSEDVYDALALMKLLEDDISHRLERYTQCISRSTFNFVKWLHDDYRMKLRAHIRENFDTVYEEIHGHPPED
ncbi:DEAD/DEAH box helicase [Gelidibacter japonicus]|uniref:DEAD/DEAH box helicase n=1 Tax=Gelidibacter japonicus TaxID=1962232 RepID=UPI00202210EB|nr:DEAD/DEAH box helicase [Gelidibacter japonicus]MCL8006093.1 DEAD/DEAH box helicase [Gelidibacter japonicus]